MFGKELVRDVVRAVRVVGGRTKINIVIFYTLFHVSAMILLHVFLE